MKNSDHKEFVRTTVYIPRYLHQKTKMMALLTNVTISKLVQLSLVEKLKELKEKLGKNE